MTVSYDDVIQAARALQEPLDENRGSEYVRGQCELIADLFGKPSMFTSDREIEVMRDIEQVT